VSGNQNWRTPPVFLDAVRRRFGGIDWDLAATSGHEVTTLGRSFTPEDNSLAQRWDNSALGSVRFVNPPFAKMRPWAAKLSDCRDLPRWTLMLCPASMGSFWWRDHVLGKCMALGIPRMEFVGAGAVYPKDLALLCYGYGVHGFGFWDWRSE